MEGKRAKYKNIAASLRQSILSGTYVADEPIESETLLSQQFGVSRVTVRQALGMLEQEGLIDRRQGRSTIVKRKAPLYHSPQFKRIGLITYQYFDQVFEDIIEGAREKLEKNGFSLLVLRAEETVKSKRRVLQEMLKQDVDGVIIEGILSALPCYNLDLYEQLKQKKLPFVFTNGFHQEVNAPHVIIDDCDAIARIVDELARLGHRRIGGYFCDKQYQTFMRYKGYLEGLRRNHLEYDDDRVLFTIGREQAFYFNNQFFSYREALLSCTALVCYNDAAARQLMDILLHLGIRVPEQMSITGMDHLLQYTPQHKQITTAEHPKKKMGEAAAEMILEMLKTRQSVPSRMLRTIPIAGETIAPPRP
ncbi:MAG: GntR family transcriptional regulator [Eubacteriales bacterium]|nr:GntR family transcriptional regulator [Eubacteriales bacterium]